MKTIIHFIRHASYENPDRIVPGRIPGYHLGEEGKAKARRLGDCLKGRKISHFYTSPLERTFETANIITEGFPEAKINHVYDLIEVDASLWQAFKYEELFTNNYYESFLNDPDTTEVPENLRKLAARMRTFALSLCKKHKGKEIVCVSHEYPIIALRLSLEGKELKLLKNYSVAMASITTFVFDENCRLEKVDYKEIE